MKSQILIAVSALIILTGFNFGKVLEKATDVNAITGDALKDVKGAKEVQSGLKFVKKQSDNRKKAKEGMTPKQEYYLGRSLAARVFQNSPYHNTDFNRYLNELGKYLALNSGRPEIYKGYSFAVVKSDARTAMSTPGGHIIVTTGLLKTFQSEDELAGVLAHELAHIWKMHAAKAIQKHYQSEWVTVQDSLALAGDLGAVKAKDFDFFNKALGFSHKLMTQGYDRKQEIDADRYGFAILVQANFDPERYLNYLKRNDPSGGGLISNHPAIEDRIAAIEKLIRSKGREIASDRNKFGTSKLELKRQNRFNKAIGKL